MADAGDSVSAGQVLARLNLPEGGQVNVQAPIAGVISASNAVVGALASGKGEALFSIIARGEYDLVGMVPTRDIAKLAAEPDRADQDRRRRRGRRQGAAGGAHGRAEQPARPGVHRHHHQPAAVGEFVRPGADQDRAELRRLGAADRDPLRLGRHRGAGGQPRPRRDAAGRNRIDVGRPGRDPRRACRKATSWWPAPARLLREGDPVRPVMAAADAK